MLDCEIASEIAREHLDRLLPADSEHSAALQVPSANCCPFRYRALQRSHLFPRCSRAALFKRATGAPGLRDFGTGQALQLCAASSAPLTTCRQMHRQLKRRAENCLRASARFYRYDDSPFFLVFPKKV